MRVCLLVGTVGASEVEAAVVQLLRFGRVRDRSPAVLFVLPMAAVEARDIEAVVQRLCL